eukprot:gb/GECG01001358.1/.p1 GENE.gb/GECG01001358.1/~~gb/GECG01001358.1/.p1  ORF type:complete len:1193 (+),score=95.44 gb/GECG01001358.1/:1-3579(+)
MYENAEIFRTTKPLARKLCRVLVKADHKASQEHEDGTAIGSFVRIPQSLAEQVVQGRWNVSGKLFPVTLSLELETGNRTTVPTAFATTDPENVTAPEVTATWNGLVHNREEVEISSSLYQTALSNYTFKNYTCGEVKEFHELTTLSATIWIWSDQNCPVASRIVATVANVEVYASLHASQETVCQLFLRRISHARVGDTICLDLGLSEENQYVDLYIKEVQTPRGATYKALESRNVIFRFVRDSELEIDLEDGSREQRQNDGWENDNAMRIMNIGMRTFAPPWILPLRSSAVNACPKSFQKHEEAVYETIQYQDRALREFQNAFEAILDRSQLTNIETSAILGHSRFVDCILVNPEDYSAFFRNATGALDQRYGIAAIDLTSMTMWVGQSHPTRLSRSTIPCTLISSKYVGHGTLLPTSACLMRLVLFFGFKSREPYVRLTVWSVRNTELLNSNGHAPSDTLKLRPVRYLIGGSVAARLRCSLGGGDERKNYIGSGNSLKEAHAVIRTCLSESRDSRQLLCWPGSIVRILLSNCFADFVVCNDGGCSPIVLGQEARVSFGDHFAIDLLEDSLKHTALIYWNEWPFGDANILKRTRSHVWEGPWEQLPGNSTVQFNAEAVTPYELPLGIVFRARYPEIVVKIFRNSLLASGRGCSLCVSGSSGTGKTTLLACLLRRCMLEIPFVHSCYVIDGKELASLEFGKAYEILTEIYAELVRGEFGCSLLFIDNLHCIVPRIRNMENAAQHELLLSHILKALLTLCSSNKVFLVSATAIEAFPSYSLPELRFSVAEESLRHRREWNLVSSVNASMCSRIILDSLRRYNYSGSVNIPWANVRKAQLTSSAKAFRLSVRRLIRENRNINAVTVSHGDGEGIEDSSPNTSMEQRWCEYGVIGMENVKKKLLEQVILPLRWRGLYSMSSSKLSGGLLLYGPPGCGKTKIAEALAKVANVNIRKLKGPELLSKYIGASEENVRRIFREAAQLAPCILLFDEFDSIATPRGSQQTTGVNDRIVNQLLTMLDGFDTNTNIDDGNGDAVSRLAEESVPHRSESSKKTAASPFTGVFVLATTSRLDLIDRALLRAGRIDQHILCPAPSSAEKLMLLWNLLETAHIEEEAQKILQDFATQSCETYADVQSLVTTAVIYASYSAKGCAVSNMHVTTAHATKAIKDIGYSNLTRAGSYRSSQPKRTRVALE